jgi:hypothetical protein
MFSFFILYCKKEGKYTYKTIETCLKIKHAPIKRQRQRMIPIESGI